MKSEDKVVNLFCIYTILSIVISILAWMAVGLGLISIPTVYNSSIGIAGWALAGVTYMLGLVMVYRLKKHGETNIPVFAIYPVIQALTLGHSYVSHGWYYAPSAGSQGTIPALVISLVMLVYLFIKTQRPLKLA